MRVLLSGLIVVLAAVAAGCTSGSNSSRGTAPTPEQVRAIAKDAYVYGFPMVDNYRIQYSYFVNEKDSNFKGPWNQAHSIARVFTPADTAVQTPNSDTPYTMLGADLRAEPLVLTVPPMEKNRYFSLQFIDGYTYDYAYVGSRVTGNGGGKYLLAGPGWKGEKPEGIDKVINCDTEFSLVIYRTQLFDPADLGNVKKIQDGYKVEPLSRYQGEPAKTAPAMNFVTPLTPDEQKTSPKFFQILNFVLGTAPVLPDEKALRARFASIGIAPDGDFNPEALSAENLQAVKEGMADAWAELTEFQKTKLNTGKVTSAQLFGTREEMKGNYLYRWAGSVLGIYGNVAKEALYPVIANDSTGAPLTGANSYTLRFAPGELPPVNSFWSITMYKMPQSLLVANPIDRYLINSPMLPDLKRDADGGYTIYVQNASPGADKEVNWLPAPEGSFQMIMRLYWPKEPALDGSWTAPKAVRVGA